MSFHPGLRFESIFTSDINIYWSHLTHETLPHVLPFSHLLAASLKGRPYQLKLEEHILSHVQDLNPKYIITH